MKLKYQNIFLPGTKERARIDTIMGGHKDPQPDSSNSQIFDLMLKHLASGLGNPKPLKKPKKGARIDVVVDGDLIPRLHEAMDELFTIYIERKPNAT